MTEQMNDLTIIRQAGPDDAAAVAAIHCESWRSAYRGILPDVYLDQEAPAERLRYWRAKLAAAKEGGFVLLAVNGGDPVGFVAVSRPGEPGYDADIDSLHVSPDVRGGGVGRRLLGAAAQRLLTEGAGSACLRVYDANEAAARFYRRLGGMADATGIDPFAGADMPDTRYGWRDLAALATACASTPERPA
jgi:ribosomal protein S18 acetylase RimI-like enzyme